MSENNSESKISINGETNLYSNIATKICNLIDTLDIKLSDNSISIDNIIKIIGEINKAIAETREISETLISISPDEKAEKVFKIIIDLLNNPKISEKLSESVRNEIKNYANNKELVNTIGDLVNWVSDSVLNSYDNNNDGIITVDEISTDVVNCCICKSNTSEGCACYRNDGCCSCCQKFAKGFGICWGKFFTNILCCGCGSNKISIK